MQDLHTHALYKLCYSIRHSEQLLVCICAFTHRGGLSAQFRQNAARRFAQQFGVGLNRDELHPAINHAPGIGGRTRMHAHDQIMWFRRCQDAINRHEEGLIFIVDAT